MVARGVDEDVLSREILSRTAEALHDARPVQRVPLAPAGEENLFACAVRLLVQSSYVNQEVYS